MRSAALWFALLAALPCAAGDASGQDAQDVTRKGGTLKTKLGAIAAYSLPASSVRDVAVLTHVSYVTPDRGVRGQLVNSTAAVNAGIAWKYGWTGADCDSVVWADFDSVVWADSRAAATGRVAIAGEG